MVASARLPRDGATLRRAALAYPEAYEAMPWGHHAIKVKGKAFVFLAADAETFSLSAKLPSSAGVALKLPFASPTEYGLGRSGWITARFPRTERLPDRRVDLILPGQESHLSLADIGGEEPCHELGSNPTEAAELSGQNLIFCEHP